MAIGRRKPLLTDETNACRLCFSEADELPGLGGRQVRRPDYSATADEGSGLGGVREVCVRVLREELKPAAIVERPDPRMRELEGLSAPSAEPSVVGRRRGADATTQFRLNGTGVSLRPERWTKDGGVPRSARQLRGRPRLGKHLGSTGRALDVCCYQGGFALHLAEVCKQVTGIDASRSSLEVAEQNLASIASGSTPKWTG